MSAGAKTAVSGHKSCPQEGNWMIPASEIRQQILLRRGKLYNMNIHALAPAVPCKYVFVFVWKFDYHRD